jgi:hypothetical protein
MRAHMKEILHGEYTTDRPFESGFFRDRLGAMDIRGTLGDVTFAGISDDPAVLGLIKLGLAEAKITDNSSHGWTWDQLDVAGGGEAGPATVTGENDLNRHWQHNRSRSSGRVGGDERLQLSFERELAFITTVNFEVSSRLEKHAKLMPTGRPQHHTERMGPRLMAFALPETEALAHYAEGRRRCPTATCGTCSAASRPAASS